MTELCKFTIQVLVHSVKTFLKFFGGKLANRVVCRVMVDVRQKNGLRERGTNMFSRAPITVPTRPDLFNDIISDDGKQRNGRWYLVIKWTIYSILLCTEDIGLFCLSEWSFFNKKDGIPDVKPLYNTNIRYDESWWGEKVLSRQSGSFVTNIRIWACIVDSYVTVRDKSKF